MEIAQAHIKFNENIYYCNGTRIVISCPTAFENSTVDECSNEAINCGVRPMNSSIYCLRAALLSRTPVFCNSTKTVNAEDVDESVTILNCYEGQLPASMAAFIPTSTTEAPKTNSQTTHEVDQLSSEENVTHWVPVALTISSEVIEFDTFAVTTDNDFLI